MGLSLDEFDLRLLKVRPAAPAARRSMMLAIGRELVRARDNLAAFAGPRAAGALRTTMGEVLEERVAKYHALAKELGFLPPDHERGPLFPEGGT